jgi:hypothetical protein
MPYRESVYENLADRFDVAHVIDQLRDAWRSIPQDQKSLLVSYAKQLWPVRGMLLAKLVVLAFGDMRRGIPMQAALHRAAYRLGVRRRDGGVQSGMSTTQVQQYRRRQMQRQPSSRRKPGYPWRR